MKYFRPDDKPIWIKRYQNGTCAYRWTNRVNDCDPLYLEIRLDGTKIEKWWTSSRQMFQSKPKSIKVSNFMGEPISPSIYYELAVHILPKIDSFPKIIDSDDQCCICNEDEFKESIFLPCGHSLHVDCFSKMVLHSTDLHRCPLCRFEI